MSRTSATTGTLNRLSTDTFAGNSFQSLSATKRNLLLAASSDFVVEVAMEIGASFYVEVPATSTLEVLAFAQPSGGTITGSTLSNEFMGDVWDNQGPIKQSVSLLNATDFIALEAVEVGAAATLDIPFDGSLEIKAYVDNATPVSYKNFSNPVSFSYFSTVAQNSGNNAFAQTLFQTLEYDTGGNVIASTFTAPFPGVYTFKALTANNVGSLKWIVSLFKNGSEFRRGVQLGASTTQNWASLATGDMKLVKGDTVDARTFADTTTAIAVAQATCYFQGNLVSTS